MKLSELRKLGELGWDTSVMTTAEVKTSIAHMPLFLNITQAAKDFVADITKYPDCAGQVKICNSYEDLEKTLKELEQ
jgi:hypothetical protein